MTLVKLAYAEMVAKSQSGNHDAVISKYIPGAMTALIIPAAAETKVILASSMRRNAGHHSLRQSDYLYSNQRLKEALDRVPLYTKYSTHQTGACGELVAYHVWSRLMYGPGNGLKVITWGRKGLKDPCTKVAMGGGWGCHEFVVANEITPIPRLSQVASLPTFEVLRHPEFSDVTSVICSLHMPWRTFRLASSFFH